MGTKLNKKGFSTVEILIVLLVVLVLALGGWLVYKNNHKTKKTTTTSTSSNMNNMNMGSNSSYAGWKTATLKYEKITFMYPSDWTFNAVENPNSSTNCLYPGNDLVTLTSPTGAEVDLSAGTKISCGGGGTSIVNVLEKLPTKSLGKNLNIVFANLNGNSPVNLDKIAADLVTDVCLTDLADENPCSMRTMNVYTDSSMKNMAPGVFEFLPVGYKAGRSGSSNSYLQNASQIKASTEFKDAQLIFESMTY